MASNITATYETAPAALTNNLGAQLNVELPDDCSAARHLVAHAKATPVAGMGQILVSYRYILILIGSVARIDGAPATLALHPLRGTFLESWMQNFLTRLETLGLFGVSHSSFVAMLLHAVELTRGLAALPADFIITVADYVPNLAWVPGHFGAAAAQPWHCGLTFGHVANTTADSLFPLFVFCFECAPFYVRAQVAAGANGFVMLGAAYLSKMEVGYAGLPAGSMPAGLAQLRSPPSKASRRLLC